jgi:hypothetical protein
MYRAHPRFGDSAGAWQAGFRRELDMTNDSHAFVQRDAAIRDGFVHQSDGTWASPRSTHVLIPVYEGKMVHQFSATAKSHALGQGRSAVWFVSPPSQAAPISNFLVDEGFARDRGWNPVERAGYCEISGHANERTVLSSLIPQNAVCGNKVPTLTLTSEDTLSDHLVWIALANSLVVDWIMRRWVSTTVNFFFWENVPLPRRDGQAVHWPRLSAVSEWLCKSRPPTESQQLDDWFGQRALGRAYIDATVARLYRLDRTDLGLILDDFPLLDRGRGQDHDAKRITTKDLLLKAFDYAVAGDFNPDEFGGALGVSAREACRAYVPHELAQVLG